MPIAMFPYIGIAIQAKWIYWVCFGLYFFEKILEALYEE